MKKLLSLSVLFFGLLFNVLAQAPAEVKRTEEYCQMVATAKPFSTKVVIQVDYGQETKFFGGGTEVVKDEAGKMQNFNSVVDAMNYMNSKGWEFISANIVTVSGSNVYHYLFRRKVNADATGK
jgi:hypothetical protein